MKEISSGTVQGMFAFLDTLVEKGRITDGQSKPMKVVATKVFETVDGPTWLQTNIRDVDVSDYIARFINKTDVFYTKESLQTYKSRLNRALEWYTNFLDNPGWVPKTSGVRQKSTSKDNRERKSPSIESVRPTLHRVAEHDSSMNEHSFRAGAELITYPFPLSNGQLARLSLPLKLSHSEAKRLAAFIDSLAMDEVVNG